MSSKKRWTSRRIMNQAKKFSYVLFALYSCSWAGRGWNLESDLVLTFELNHNILYKCSKLCIFSRLSFSLRLLRLLGNLKVMDRYPRTHFLVHLWFRIPFWWIRLLVSLQTQVSKNHQHRFLPRYLWPQEVFLFQTVTHLKIWQY